MSTEQEDLSLDPEMTKARFTDHEQINTLAWGFREAILTIINEDLPPGEFKLSVREAYHAYIDATRDYEPTAVQQLEQRRAKRLLDETEE